MFLIDKPYISDFLLKTIRDNNYEVVSTKEAKELISDDSVNWISEKTAIRVVRKYPDTPIYTNSENAIAWITTHIGSSGHASQVQLFKNKFKFREFIKGSFPEFFYKSVELDEIQKLNLEGIEFPFVIKPSIGFFSLGVHIVRNMTDWEKVKNELNYKTLQGIYPKEVLDTSTFIIEEYIKGEEYAVDGYFNKDGEIVILNILHHKFSSGTDVSDRVYSTSKTIILKYRRDIEKFLTTIGNKAGLINFPLHVEIRISANGHICPIEINPLRFGGWCTTGDLSWYAFGINVYDYFINNLKPDWGQIFNTLSDKKYSIVVLNNNSGFTPSEISSFDYDLLARDFENPLIIRKFDIQKYPIFGFIFTETSSDNEEELNQVLVSDLRKYIITH